MKPDPEALRGLIQAFIHRFGLLDQTRTPCGLPISVSDAHALMEILKDPGIDQMELSRHLGLSKSATSRLLLRLVKRGKVKRTKNRNDGRAYNLNLTDKGKRQAEMINRESLKIFGAIISGLSEDAAQQLMQSLPLLINALPESRQIMKSELVQLKTNDYQKE
jgi:DNA-binding MarR family transcriptional regulator